MKTLNSFTLIHKVHEIAYVQMYVVMHTAYSIIVQYRMEGNFGGGNIGEFGE